MQKYLDLHDQKKKTQGFLEETAKQNLRKRNFNVSRVLDNYFYPKLHGRAWWPNGVYIIKKQYGYSDSGLNYFYEKNNVEQLKDITIEPKRRSVNAFNVDNSFVECTYLSKAEYTVTIEYCANCEEHATHTRHSADVYKNFALKIQKCIMLRFPFMIVLLKPIDTDIIKEEALKFPRLKQNGGRYDKITIINDKFKEVRIGALEIQISGMKNGGDKFETFLLHSKLRSGKWPKIERILDKIVSFLPKFSCEVNVFEKQEETDSTEENGVNGVNEHENEIQTKIQYLQVNVYLLKNEKVQRLIQQSIVDEQNETDPHKRKEMLKEVKKLEKESMYRPCTAAYKSLARSQSLRSLSTLRPPSSISAHSAHQVNLLRNSSSSHYMKQQQQQYAPSTQMIIYDKDKAAVMKGKLLITKYTNENGSINIGPLPYDTYLIEVVESNHFQYAAMPLVFSTISHKKAIRKYIGLFSQENAFIQLHVYEVNAQGEKVHLNECKVTLKTCVKQQDEEDDDNSSSLGVMDVETRETKIELKQSREGIFELMTKTGRYLVEVFKDNYDIVRRFYDLDKGLNYFNIEMTREKNVNVVLKVFRFDKFLNGKVRPVKNAEVVIYKNSREIICEGITNAKGEMRYVVTKNEDFLTIVVSKLNYKQTQRMFIRNSNSTNSSGVSKVVNENNEIEEVINVFLVKEDFMSKHNCSVMLTYGNAIQQDVNSLERNIHIDASLAEKVSIIHVDGIEQYGILATIFNGADPSCFQEDVVVSDNNNNNNNNNTETTKEYIDYSSIIKITYMIKRDELCISNYQDKGWSMNGLERYCYETMVYTPYNVFYIPAPKVAECEYNQWILGWFDIKNHLLYETNYLALIGDDVQQQQQQQHDQRIQNFDEFVEFLQVLLQKKMFLNLFKEFEFHKGMLVNNDRCVKVATFKKKLEEMKFVEGKDKAQGVIKVIVEMARGFNKMISFTLLKKKVVSNLKNFKDVNGYNNNVSGQCVEDAQQGEVQGVVVKEGSGEVSGEMEEEEEQREVQQEEEE